MDLDALLARLPDITPERLPSTGVVRASAEKVKIGVARDKAFCFYYPENLELLADSGAVPVYFSPIEDQDLPEDLAGIYLGGGYPELFAEKLSANRAMCTRVRQLSQKGMPIYAECGGFMYLCRTLCDTRERVWPMTGCFPFDTRMFPRLKALGYREVTLDRDTIIGPAGRCIRGHEFHYSGIQADHPSRAVDTVYRVAARSGMKTTPEGYQVNQTLGSYQHLHFGSCPEAAAHFVKACEKYAHERNRQI